MTPNACQAKRTPGRPVWAYDPAIGDEICRLVAQGQTTRRIQAMAGMPDWDTVRKWLRQDQGFAAQYTHTREESAEALEQEIVEIARTLGDDADGRMAHTARVRIDALKWIASKRYPRAYGDFSRSQIETTVSSVDLATAAALLETDSHGRMK